MIRTDAHRPSAIVPSEYEYIAPDHTRIDTMGDVFYATECRRRIREHQAKTGGKYASHQHGGNCMVCGSVNAIWTVLFYHQPSNTYVRTGLDCADKLDEGQHAGEINAFTRGMRDALEAAAGKRKAEKLLTDNGNAAAWTVYTAGNTAQYEERTIVDIVGKLVRYGSISEKSMNYVGILLDKLATRDVRNAERTAQRAAEDAFASECPTGRATITGRVISVKTQESDYGTQYTMLVRDNIGGFKVWCSIPSAYIDDVNRDCTVTFACTITPSKDDAKFGFGKRPHMTLVVPAGPVLV